MPPRLKDLPPAVLNNMDDEEYSYLKRLDDEQDEMDRSIQSMIDEDGGELTLTSILGSTTLQ